MFKKIISKFLVLLLFVSNVYPAARETSVVVEQSVDVIAEQSLKALEENKLQELSKLLMSNREYINFKYAPDNATLLMKAAERGNEQAVNLLVNLGADVNLCNRENRSATQLALRNNYFPIALMLISVVASKEIEKIDKVEESEENTEESESISFAEPIPFAERIPLESPDSKMSRETQSTSLESKPLPRIESQQIEKKRKTKSEKIICPQPGCGQQVTRRGLNKHLAVGHKILSKNNDKKMPCPDCKKMEWPTNMKRHRKACKERKSEQKGKELIEREQEQERSEGESKSSVDSSSTPLRIPEGSGSLSSSIMSSNKRKSVDGETNDKEKKLKIDSVKSAVSEPIPSESSDSKMSRETEATSSESQPLPRIESEQIEKKRKTESEKIICPQAGCGKEVTRRGLNKHLSVGHKIPSSTNIKKKECKDCGKLEWSGNMSRHRKTCKKIKSDQQGKELIEPKQRDDKTAKEGSEGESKSSIDGSGISLRQPEVGPGLSAEKPVVCTQGCGMICKSERGLINHLSRTHKIPSSTNIKKIKCDDCGKEELDSNMPRHKRKYCKERKSEQPGKELIERKQKDDKTAKEGSEGESKSSVDGSSSLLRIPLVVGPGLGLSSSLKADKNHDQLIIDAMYGDEIESFESLLTDKNIETVDEKGNTILTIAVKDDNEEIVRLLLERGADIEVLDDQGNSILTIAVKNNNEEIARLLIEDYLADVNEEDEEGNSILTIAVQNKNEKIVQMILEYGSFETSDIDTAIDMAEKLKHEKIKEILTKFKVQLEVMKKKGHSQIPSPIPVLIPSAEPI